MSHLRPRQILPLVLPSEGGQVEAGRQAQESLVPKLPDMGAAPAATNTMQDFAVREQLLRESAAAGGVARNENEADLLGYTGGVRRKNASRLLLG